MNKLMIVATLAVAAAGCTSVSVTREGCYNKVQDDMTDCSYNPYHIDWDIKGDRVTASGTSKCWFWFFASSDGYRYASPSVSFDSGTSAAKDSATYHAVDNAKSDALLGCMYRVTKTSKWLGIYKETKAEVTGFPANVKSIELIKDRPVVVDKDKQIVRIPAWETLSNGKSSGGKLSGMFSF